ncbi:unnamed protein product [Lactuca virosa]|uniref:Uncharacterized protein n=1 Tax=Lactuca virosa TaxID=75947 RepID=A0AAU9M2F0_9ASTR|nr:unnamed protein product [Lactuca virosa]
MEDKKLPYDENTLSLMIKGYVPCLLFYLLDRLAFCLCNNWSRVQATDRSERKTKESPSNRGRRNITAYTFHRRFKLKSILLRWSIDSRCVLDSQLRRQMVFHRNYVGFKVCSLYSTLSLQIFLIYVGLKYKSSEKIDQLRVNEYSHLTDTISKFVCLTGRICFLMELDLLFINLKNTNLLFFLCSVPAPAAVGFHSIIGISAAKASATSLELFYL